MITGACISGVHTGELRRAPEQDLKSNGSDSELSWRVESLLEARHPAVGSSGRSKASRGKLVSRIDTALTSQAASTLDVPAPPPTQKAFSGSKLTPIA
jgi:hypothetical protein